MAIPEDQIQQTMKILTSWNPLGDRSAQITDLDNYRTEAIDILFHMDSKIVYSDPSIVVMEILNQAFDLNLSKDDCLKPANEIIKIISEK